jgi:hypothetical protein
MNEKTAATGVANAKRGESIFPEQNLCHAAKSYAFIVP